jgi:hypothetical protein
MATARRNSSVGDWRRIFSAIGPASKCDLDTLVSRCGYFSWNQVFLEVNHMSRPQHRGDDTYHVRGRTLRLPFVTRAP